MRRLFHGTPPSSIARSCKIISSVEVEGCNSRGIIVPRGNEDKDEDDDGAGTSISASQSALGPFEDVIGENSARLWKDFPKTLSQESERKQVDDVPGRDTTASCGGEGGFATRRGSRSAPPIDERPVPATLLSLLKTETLVFVEECFVCICIGRLIIPPSFLTTLLIFIRFTPDSRDGAVCGGITEVRRQSMLPLLSSSIERAGGGG